MTSMYVATVNAYPDFGLVMAMMTVGIIQMKTLNIAPPILANLLNLDVPMAGVFSTLGNVTMRMIVVMVPMNKIVTTRIAVLENLLAKIIGE